MPLEKAARILAKASKILTEELDLVAEHDADLGVAALWTAVEEAVPRTAVSSAVATVEALVPEDDGSAEAAMREKPAAPRLDLQPVPHGREPVGSVRSAVMARTPSGEREFRRQGQRDSPAGPDLVS